MLNYEPQLSPTGILFAIYARGVHIDRYRLVRERHEAATWLVDNPQSRTKLFWLVLGWPFWPWISYGVIVHG